MHIYICDIYIYMYDMHIYIYICIYNSWTDAPPSFLSTRPHYDTTKFYGVNTKDRGAQPYRKQ